MSVRARVTLTIEVDVDDTWNGNVCADQVARQASESAVGRVRNGCGTVGWKVLAVDVDAIIAKVKP
jgi:hypothetical protein